MPNFNYTEKVVPDGAIKVWKAQGPYDIQRAINERNDLDKKIPVSKILDYSKPKSFIINGQIA